MSEEFGLQPVTTAMAFVYFEKLVLQGRLNKQNRKLVAAACVLLAAKISSDLRKPEVKQLIDVSEHRSGDARHLQTAVSGGGAASSLRLIKLQHLERLNRIVAHLQSYTETCDRWLLRQLFAPRQRHSMEYTVLVCLPVM